MPKAILLLFAFAALLGCGDQPTSTASQPREAAIDAIPKTLAEARLGFKTKLVTADEPAGPPDEPPAGVFDLIHYKSPVGDLAAYVTPDPGDNEKHPAILWITGGDNNSISDVWSPSDSANDQSARAFREAGVVMMFPSQRGGNDNPGRREGFFGEVDDVVAAAEHLANLSYVDADRVYLGGHSTGATLAMLIGECTDRFKAVFCLGPVASPSQYGGAYVYCDLDDKQEMQLRSPYRWLDSVASPMYVLEGVGGNWEGAAKIIAEDNKNPLVRVFPIQGHDHFTVIAPLTEILAEQIIADDIEAIPGRLKEIEP